MSGDAEIVEMPTEASNLQAKEPWKGAKRCFVSCGGKFKIENFIKFYALDGDEFASTMSDAARAIFHFAKLRFTIYWIFIVLHGEVEGLRMHMRLRNNSETSWSKYFLRSKCTISSESRREQLRNMTAWLCTAHIPLSLFMTTLSCSTIMLFHLINPERLVTSENWFPRKGKFLIDCDQLKVGKLNAFIHFESNYNFLTHISVSKRIQRILMESIEFLNESIVKDFESQPKQCHFHPSPISTVLLNNKVTIYTLFTFPI